MVLGIGVDLVKVQRFNSWIQNRKLVERFFSAEEVKILDSKVGVAQSLAARFAAKEAFAKALGTGFREGVFMKDIAIVHQKSGKPQLKIYGGALKHLQKLSKGKEYNLQVSMSDDYPWAQAFVIIELI